ncbi:ferric iron reductase protein FhuF [Rhizobium sp. RU20A]|uniref:siderophore-iron reductase FhuF n=1 Tax=Rhizobium sp. RU20A TaxID=1907412 RepID=UPI00095752AC|nr:siderophore-iron reductase FhuF [Rhizobium sp. RU20A]SIQ24122.1 ferric iron reductase protein FhuF [Rhizobium sp. RU20A]
MSGSIETSLLSRAFTGPHAWCGEKVVAAESLSDAMPLPDFFLGGHFDAVIDARCAETGCSDRRAMASLWSLYYFSCLGIPYVLARRLEGEMLPVAFEDTVIALTPDGLPRAFGLSGPVEQAAGDIGDGVLATLNPLVTDHFREAVRLMKAHGGIAPKLAWNNAAVYLDYALRTTLNVERLPEADTLVEETLLPDGSPNPFCGALRYEDESGARVCRRKVCCLRYLVPGVESCGSLCALPSQRNAASTH